MDTALSNKSGNRSSNTVASHIASLSPYVPGKPIDEVKRELGLKRVVKLASNENPLGPSPKAVVAIRKALKELHRYPDAAQWALKQTLSRTLKVAVEQIAIGNGSNELITNLIRTWTKEGDSVVIPETSFIAYQISAQAHGVKVLQSKVKPDLKFDLDHALELLKADLQSRMVFIANPNNPTGALLSRQELVDFIKATTKLIHPVWVVLDYAYWEYVSDQDLLDPQEALEKFENVFVLRTFSKIYGLAGARVGYLVGPREGVSYLERVRDPFNINSLALIGAEAALRDTFHLRKTIKSDRQGREFLERRFSKAGISFYPGGGNFILIDCQKSFGKTGSEVQNHVLPRGLILRPLKNYGLDWAIRMTIGKPEENQFAVRILEDLKKS